MAQRALHPPSTSPSPPLPPAVSIPQSATLAARINSATRKQHTELNQLIIQRVPRALPPHANTPLLFSKGLVPFARIFILFEIEWDELNRKFQRNSKTFSGHDWDVRNWLAGLRPAGLARSPRLRNDLRHLCSMEGPGIYETPDTSDKWVADMQRLVRDKPHVVVAFAWVFYMAVFSGGRWIRQQLASTGAKFWIRRNRSLQQRTEQLFCGPEVPGITFLSFDGENDGEDLKALFKTRLANAEDLLSETEKQEIIEVAQQLFDRCICLVNDLDQMVFRQRMLNGAYSILRVSVVVVALLYAFLGPRRFNDFLSAFRAS